MPVPVPRVYKQPAHSVKKPRIVSNPLQSLTCSLPVSPPGPPPSFGTREEWINSLPTWRRTKPRHIWEEDSRLAGARAEPGFHSGLAVAPNDAPAIKGSRAEACIPPLSSMFPAEPLGFEGDADDEMSSDYSLVERVSNDRDSDWSCSSMGMDVDYHSQAELSVYSPPTIITHGLYERGAFTPVFEDQSPGVYSGPDQSSSPIGPVTPFGEYVDRVVAEGAKSQAELPSSAPPSYDGHTFESSADARGQKNVADSAPAPEVVTPTATVGYRKLAEPLADWVANYVWKACTTGFSLPPAFICSSVPMKPRASSPPSYLASAVHSLLLSTLLQPSAVFLALWYIVRLPVCYDAAPLGPAFGKESIFRAHLLGMGYDQEASEASAPFRLVVLGCMLANKWLDDHTFSNKTWHSISNVPIHMLNKLESLALDIFCYDLSVSTSDWSKWLTHLMSYHQLLASPMLGPTGLGRPQPISRPSTTPHGIIRRALEDISHARSGAEPVFIGLDERRRDRIDRDNASAVVQEIDLDEDGPLREEYLPKRRSSGSIRSFDEDVIHGQNQLPPPAPWSPAGDEPILRDRNRVSGHYVAVQAPLMVSYPAAPAVFHHHMAHDGQNQNWPPAPTSYAPAKPAAVVGYMFDTAVYPFVPTHAVHGHHRSQSLSYDQDNTHSRNRLRSCSQSLGYHARDPHVAIPGMDPRVQCHHWAPAPAHYGYPGLWVL
ncbi:unnamed protein product [Mycena citricolor]|uniref:Cyclin N-terminal domain-containing protein n=1 Tax=Mycena citricolor TaxID=2018698 RepID=A0AAD2K2Z7_9AGAR|nr:unnamed protein product [Mycena citricolor]CAK5276027.1 unnamed protein product [Mycena citricolor]